MGQCRQANEGKNQLTQAYDANNLRFHRNSPHSLGSACFNRSYRPTSVSARPPSSAPVCVSRIKVPSASKTLFRRPTFWPVLLCQM